MLGLSKYGNSDELECLSRSLFYYKASYIIFVVYAAVNKEALNREAFLPAYTLLV